MTPSRRSLWPSAGGSAQSEPVLPWPSKVYLGLSRPVSRDRLVRVTGPRLARFAASPPAVKACFAYPLGPRGWPGNPGRPGASPVVVDVRRGDHAARLGPQDHT